MTNLSHNFEGDQEHPPQEQFLLFVDGELSPKENERWQSHLDACWACRVRVAKIQETITEIVEFETTVSQFQSSRSDSNWGNFDSRLHALSLEVHPRTFLSRISDLWKHSEHFRFFRTPLRFAVPSLAALLIVAIVYQFVLAPPVTAAEVLRLSVEAHAKQVEKTSQPVIHQRMLVRTGSGSDRILETWNDTVNLRVKQQSSPHYEGGVASASDDGAVLSDLRRVLKTNGMNEHRPLSAASYKAWSDGVGAKTEELETTGDKLTITTSSRTATVGQIAQARLSVDANTYHPTSLYINVKTSDTNGGGQEFELVEQSYEVVSLKDIDPTIFADPTKVEVASTVGALGSPPSKGGVDGASSDGVVVTDTTNTNANTSAPAVAATTADEVEVLNRLHQIGADITEQLNVTRTADGRLLVEGLVETAGRKQEILNALAPVRNNPAIRIKIQTLEEATKALQRQKAQATPGTVERVEVEKGNLAVDAELRAHFERTGGDVDEKIRAFASRVINRSKGAAFQASALNRMANRFNAEQLKALDPAARAKYLGMLKGYAAAVRRETAALRGELQPVFGDVSDAGVESVTSDADLIASARRLFDLASQNDRVIRSAFTISSGGISVSAIKSAQFRRTVGQAESLAAAIERAR